MPGKLVLPLPRERLPPVAVVVTDELELDVGVLEYRVNSEKGRDMIGVTGTDVLARPQNA